MIRIAVDSDASQVRECAEQAYQRYVSVMGRKPAPMLADFAAQIAEDKVYVATDEAGQVQGFIVFYPKERHMFLENVAVLPEFAGQGLGRLLIEFCEDEARRQGMGAVHLYTNELMTENLAMYPHMGYVEFGRRQDDGFNRVYFEKRLN
ncbi:GNAT family N-acetyltransferase [Verticiella sediminum]|uniref:GNAT family N-acetyltransferase n=1 Tax=Verticiella sediminum TaxID=1247510 RepID=A0A556AU25_9BURK|nr:GNAT family N-acetyltransferase [Verticiella sediminum]TSH96453.1 GNAT family N-acetyltransferase [Verticiella sediminum]